MHAPRLWLRQQHHELEIAMQGGTQSDLIEHQLAEPRVMKAALAALAREHIVALPATGKVGAFGGQRIHLLAQGLRVDLQAAIGAEFRYQAMAARNPVVNQRALPAQETESAAG